MDSIISLYLLDIVYSLKGCTLLITSCNFSAKPVKLALSPP
jgi:hypothetical protein